MKIEKIDINGKKNSIEVLDKIFSGKINKKLVDNVLYKTNAKQSQKANFKYAKHNLEIYGACNNCKDKN